MRNPEFSEIVGAIRKNLDRFIGQKININTSYNLKQVILSTIYSCMGVSEEIDHIDFEVVVEGSQCQIVPKNFYTALVFAGIEAPTPPFLGEYFRTEDGIYSFEAPNLIWRPREE
jgi:hypothetical protein